MAILKWDRNLSVGVQDIDVEHKQLVLILGRLFRGLTGLSRVDLPKNLNALAEKAACHFSHEEHLLRLTDFPHAGPHRREHAGFLKRLFEIQLGLRAGDPGALTPGAVVEVGEWLETHIRESDSAFSSYLNLRGIR